MNKYIGLHYPSCTLSTLLNLLNKLGKIRPPTLSAVPMARLPSCGDTGTCGGHAMRQIFKLQHKHHQCLCGSPFRGPLNVEPGTSKMGAEAAAPDSSSFPPFVSFGPLCKCSAQFDAFSIPTSPTNRSTGPIHSANFADLPLPVRHLQHPNLPHQPVNRSHSFC
jgi:hypothetical protein